MASPFPPKTFHIVYGFAEGPWLGRHLVSALEAKGFRPAKLPEATVVIAHSGGGYLAPHKPEAPLTVIIGLPYWPAKTLPKAFAQKIRDDARTYAGRLPGWIYKTFWNTWYALSRPRRNIRMLWAMHQADKLQRLPQSAIVIRNQGDHFCIPDIDKYLQRKVLRVTGQHDDCWRNPDPYITIIEQNYAALLAQADTR